MNTSFAQGQVVIIKSINRRVVITKVEEGRVFCAWFNKTLHDGWFANEDVEHTYESAKLNQLTRHEVRKKLRVIYNEGQRKD